MKRGLIKEAFRLQQIAGLRPINEILPSSDTPRRKGLQREQMGQEGQQYIKITGGSRGEIEDVEILDIPGDPDSYMQNEYDEEINRRTDNGTDEEEMENIEEFADFNKVGDGMYQMVFNPEESAAFISANLPKVNAYMKQNGYNSVESLVEYLVEEADSAEIYDFLDQIGAEGI